uniref:transposase n=1 Tax=Geobacillus thermoleovorans TaxID=33941 RepID=UPI000A4FB286
MYIHYNRNQLILPMNLDNVHSRTSSLPDCVSSRKKMDPALLVSLYLGGKHPAYYPKMILKVILYAHVNWIDSSRQIDKQLRENIYFMWLSGHQTPDFRTINRFRSERMKDVIYETFCPLSICCTKKGLSKLEDYFLDGKKKIEANTNQYSFRLRQIHRNLLPEVGREILANHLLD